MVPDPGDATLLFGALVVPAAGPRAPRPLRRGGAGRLRGRDRRLPAPALARVAAASARPRLPARYLAAARLVPVRVLLQPALDRRAGARIARAAAALVPADALAARARAERRRARAALLR